MCRAPAVDVGPAAGRPRRAYGAGFEDLGRDEVAEPGLMPVGVTAGPVNDGLIAAVRGDDLPATARTSLQSHVSRLRASRRTWIPHAATSRVRALTATASPALRPGTSSRVDWAVARLRRGARHRPRAHAVGLPRVRRQPQRDRTRVIVHRSTCATASSGSASSPTLTSPTPTPGSTCGWRPARGA